VCVDGDGAVLGPHCALVRRIPRGYRCLSPEEAGALQEFLFGVGNDPDWLFDQCRRIAKALADDQMTLAQIFGLRIPIVELDPRQLEQLSAAAPFIKANFNPGEPRVPAGQRSGGEWTTGGGNTAGASGSSGREAQSPAGGGDSEGPPIQYTIKIPQEAPATARERNSVLRQAATWLRMAAAVGAALAPEATAFRLLLETTAWIAAYLPWVWSYLGEPETLDELQNAVNDPEPGYESTTSSRSKGTRRTRCGTRPDFRS